MSRPALYDPMDYSLPGSSVHWISQATIPEWVALSSSRGSSQIEDRTHVSWIGRWILYYWATREALVHLLHLKNIYLGTSMVVQWLRLHLPMQGVWVWSLVEGFPDSSVGKESTCNAGDPGSIPGSGRSVGEGLAYPLQYSWASLVAQLLKNPSAMQETWVRSLGWEDPLDKGKATHSNILA